MSELVRANRVSVQAKDEGGFVATFYRTHKVVATVDSIGVEWGDTTGLNKTAQREMFRIWVCEHSQVFGIAYDPVDRRDTPNQMPAKYTSDELLLETAGNLVASDIHEWVDKASKEWNLPLEVIGIVGEEIVPVTHRNGKDVSPKYGNGNWAWALVKVLVTVQSCGVEGYATMECSLVSGQLKKPVTIGELGYTYTGLKTEIAKDLQGVIDASKATPEESKTEPKVEEQQAPAPAQEEVAPTQEVPATEEVPTKKTRKPRKSKKVDAQ